MSRPPSSSSSSSSSSTQPTSLNSTLARVHGHDHNRPLPPPRLHEGSAGGNVAPVTAPLTPLSNPGGIRTSSRAPAPVPVHESRLDQPRNTVAGVVSEVTLTVPRPDGERAVNEYVETPFRPNNLVGSQKCMKFDRTKRHHHHHHHHHNRQGINTGRNNVSGSTPLASPGKNSAVTKQPVSFTKEPTNSIGSPGSLSQIQIQQQQLQQRSNLFQGIGSGGGGGGGTGNVIPLDEGLSIMCEFCGRCRCESCREPPPLPSRWLCDNACFCSAETALDYASCLCCVKGLFYHCGDAGNSVEADGEGAGSCADEPCSCTGSRRMARWTCLGALALALPCLLCYWPLKGCVALCEACYARHASHGCRCDPSTAGRHMATSTIRDSRDPEKRLLDPVTPEL